MAFDKILVPHDGSTASDRALECAIPIAEATGGRIILLNVVEEVFIPPAITDLGYSKRTGEKLTPESLAKELQHEEERKTKIMLDKIKKEYDPKGTLIESIVLVGYPSETITKFIKEQSVDLVVVGTTGLSGIHKVTAFGSVARRVSETSPCQMILVR